MMSKHGQLKSQQACLNGDQLDLHGFTAEEAIERFVQDYNQRLESGQLGGWTVVHGFGSSGKGGVIFSEFRSFLNRHRDYLRFEPGENYNTNNPGWTLVYPQKRLPELSNKLRSLTTATKRSKMLNQKSRKNH